MELRLDLSYMDGVFLVGREHEVGASLWVLFEGPKDGDCAGISRAGCFLEVK